VDLCTFCLEALGAVYTRAKWTLPLKGLPWSQKFVVTATVVDESPRGGGTYVPETGLCP
jgi:hypothetical protein